MGSRSGGLWRHPDFLKLWTGQTVSLGGSLVGRIALPLVAILTLSASPAQIAVVRIADMLPGILVGLVVGAWVDRLQRRPIMLWSDLGRALLLGSIPAMALWGLLRVEWLYLIAILVGTLTTLFEVSYRSYLPTVVRREELVEANSKLQASGAVVEIASFGIGGALVQLLTAPIAILIDAVSFLASALALALIRTPEPLPASGGESRRTWLEIREGIRFVRGHSLLRPVAGARATRDFFTYVWVSMLLLFLARDLELEPLLFGILFGIGGVSSLLGALVAERVAARWGLGRTLVVTLTVGSASLLFVPLAAGPLLLVAALVGAQQLFDAAGTIYEIHEASLVQAITPDRLLGRVFAGLNVVSWTAMLAGTLVGGVLGETIGPRATMLVGALGAIPAFLWLAWSPVGKLQRAQSRPHSEADSLS